MGLMFTMLTCSDLYFYIIILMKQVGRLLKQDDEKGRCQLMAETLYIYNEISCILKLNNQHDDGSKLNPEMLYYFYYVFIVNSTG